MTTIATTAGPLTASWQDVVSDGLTGWALRRLRLAEADDWTYYGSEEAEQAATACARGHYQAGLLRGWESWSGSTLRGKAQSYGGRYYGSRRSLVARMRGVGLEVSFAEGPHGRVVALIGCELPPEPELDERTTHWEPSVDRD